MMQTDSKFHKQITLHNEPNSTGTQMDEGGDQSSTSQATASGTAELSAQLMTGITASVSGSLETSWASHSTLSGTVKEGTRVATRAIQRRVVKQYLYQIPVAFAGYFAAYYDVPVEIQHSNVQPPSNGNNFANVLALDITSENQLFQSGKSFRNIILQGTADDVSTLAVEHTVFQTETLTNDEQPLNKAEKTRVTA